MGYPIQTNRCAVVRPRVRLEPKIEDLVRRACFTVASSSLASYGVHPNDIIDHLIHAGLAAANRAERVVEHLDGVAHAVACIRGNSRAWADLATLHGWCLERAAMEQHGAEGGLQPDVSGSNFVKARLRRPTRTFLKTACRAHDFSGMRAFALFATGLPIDCLVELKLALRVRNVKHLTVPTRCVASQPPQQWLRRQLSSVGRAPH